MTTALVLGGVESNQHFTGLAMLVAKVQTRLFYSQSPAVTTRQVTCDILYLYANLMLAIQETTLLV